MLGLIDSLQLIIHSPLVNVRFPANAFLLYEKMITVATFEILPIEDVYPLFMTFPREGSFNDRFERLDYGSYYVVMNMGTLGIFFVF